MNSGQVSSGLPGDCALLGTQRNGGYYPGGTALQTVHRYEERKLKDFIYDSYVSLFERTVQDRHFRSYYHSYPLVGNQMPQFINRLLLSFTIPTWPWSNILHVQMYYDVVI